MYVRFRVGRQIFAFYAVMNLNKYSFEFGFDRTVVSSLQMTQTVGL